MRTTLKLVAPERCVGQHLHAAVRRVRPWGTDTAGYCRTATQHSLLPALSLSLMASFRMNRKWQVTLSDPDIQTKFMTTHPHSDSHALTSNQAWSQTQTSGPDLWRCSHRLHWWLLLEEVDCVWNDVSRTWHCLRGAQVCRLLHAGWGWHWTVSADGDGEFLSVCSVLKTEIRLFWCAFSGQWQDYTLGVANLHVLCVLACSISTPKVSILWSQ